MTTRRLAAASALALVLLVSGCGGDDNTSTTPSQPSAGTSEAPTSGNATGGETGGGSSDGDSGAGDTSDPNGESALGGEPAGSVVMTVGDVTIEGEIAEGTLVEPDVAFTARGETAQIEVASTGGGAVSVTVTGAFEFEANGTATFADGTTIDSGDLAITGSGTQPDDAAPIEDFTINAAISSC